VKSTGFKAKGNELNVGDIVSFHSGYGGFFEVTERNGEYWIVDCCDKIYGRSTSEKSEEPFKLERNLDIQWTKVDKSNPFKTPPFKIECECCYTVVGEFDMDKEEFTWFDICESHEEQEDGQAFAYCSTCYPERETKIKPAPKLTEIEEYFYAKYEKASFRVMPGHWPDFLSKEEVDLWIKECEEDTAFIFNKRNNKREMEKC
jgi:hypothetical protein